MASGVPCHYQHSERSGIVISAQQALRQTTLGLAPRKTVRVEHVDSEATIQTLSGHPYLHDLNADRFEELFLIQERKPGCSTFLVKAIIKKDEEEKRRFSVNVWDAGGKRFAHIDASDPEEPIEEQAKLRNGRYELSYRHPALGFIRLVTQSAATHRMITDLAYARRPDRSLVEWCSKTAASGQGMVCSLAADPTLACIVSPFHFLDGSDGEMYEQQGFLVSTPKFNRAPKR
jgi:hypothetical protein